MVGVTQREALCSLEQVANQKRTFANLFWTMFKSKEVRESGVRWKWVTIHPCTQWLGSQRQMQRGSGNPNWLSAGTKLLQGKGPLLPGLAFLTLSFTSLGSTWVVVEESLGPECLGQRFRINVDFKLLKAQSWDPGVCLLPKVCFLRNLPSLNKATKQTNKWVQTHYSLTPYLRICLLPSSLE